MDYQKYKKKTLITSSFLKKKNEVINHKAK